MSLPLPPANKVAARTSDRPANQRIDPDEWNQLVQAVGELQGQVSAAVVLAPSVDAAALPPAGLDVLGRIFRVTSSGLPDVAMQCLQNADGSFKWVTLGQAE